MYSIFWLHRLYLFWFKILICNISLGGGGGVVMVQKNDLFGAGWVWKFLLIFGGSLLTWIIFKGHFLYLLPLHVFFDEICSNTLHACH